MTISPTSLARRLGACLLGTFLFSSVALAQMPENIVFPDDPDRTIDLGNGREVHVYNATVVRTRGDRLTVRYDHGGRYTYDVPSDFRFEMNGRKVRTRDLRPGDTLTAYVTMHENAHHAIHYVEESGGTAQVMSSTPSMPEEVLPSTASPLPLVGLLGALSVALGGLGLAIRRRIA